MLELVDEVIESLLCDIAHGLSHANLFQRKLESYVVEVVEIKLVFVHVLAKANVVDCISKDALELLRYVDTSLSLVFNFLEPFVTEYIEMLLENVDHDAKFLLVEHVCTRFPLDLPCLIALHGGPDSVEHGRKDLLYHWVFVKVLALLIVHVLNDIWV